MSVYSPKPRLIKLCHTKQISDGYNMVNMVARTYDYMVKAK